MSNIKCHRQDLKQSEVKVGWWCCTCCTHDAEQIQDESDLKKRLEDYSLLYYPTYDALEKAND